MKTLTLEQYEELHNEDCGFCIACGYIVEGGIEPDAREYLCEDCKQPKVYGFDEVLQMGLVV